MLLTNVKITANNCHWRYKYNQSIQNFQCTNIFYVGIVVKNLFKLLPVILTHVSLNFDLDFS